MGKVWNGAWEPTGEAILRIEGIILPDGYNADIDYVAPALVNAALAEVGAGDITVWINSDGGDYDAGALIYAALKEHDGYVTAKIGGTAASAASVIAMAADEVLMSPVGRMMIHRASTYTAGNSISLERDQAMLESADEGMATIYAAKTGMTKEQCLALMTEEKYMSAATAIKLGFADGMLYIKAGREVGVAAAFATAEKLYLYTGRHPTVRPEEDDNTISLRDTLMRCVHAMKEELGSLDEKIGG